MQTFARTRLVVAALALGSLGLGSVAHADPFVGRLIGSVAAGMLVNGAIKSHDKKFAAQCRLYDREGMEVYLPCDSRRPLGEVLTADKPNTMSDGLAGGPPPPAHAAPPAAYAAADDLPIDARPGECFARDGAQWARRPCDDVVHAAPAYAPPPVHHAPPPARYAPVEDDCGCEHDLRGDHAQAAYGAGRVVGVYGSSSHSSIRYSESYGHGGYGGFHPYGGVGYGAGGYADGPVRAAGRDQAGFLTWPGKRVR